MKRRLLSSLVGLTLAACATTPPMSPAQPKTADTLVAATQQTLRGEEFMIAGDEAQARLCFERAIQLTDAVLAVDAQSAPALRVRGRAMLRQFPDYPLQDVKKVFENARDAGTTDIERQRGADYVELVDGLQQFHAGKPADAWKAWSRIGDEAVKQSLTEQTAHIRDDVTFGGLSLR